MSGLPDTPDILRRIIASKVERVQERRRQISASQLESQLADAPPVRGFRAALEARIAVGQAGVIAEIKKASPSKGVLREDFDPAAIARSYARGGAACLSVLTEADFFAGADAHLEQARTACHCPVIRKDFIFDDYQVLEARVLGADCVLLIVAALDDAQLSALYQRARSLGMDVLVEVHDGAELDRALRLGGDLIGINNRDLRSFETTLETTARLAPSVPEGVRLVTESGIHTRDDVATMRARGIDAFLVGEAFMRAESPGDRLAELFD
ncbi:indole-3-glycerol phosphate synthase TrpC [Spiribacter vilamensis]|uniref:Indole-3-glycerol phosphate synthase n=1 Tax=Spiribacter vilamensis TaxID=531306 RepID=A0A4Q8D1G0_9GAMM|nr:indole-3-glycerol phosphate synthase [Spiribacter vilamensis]TVO61842.1 indole-3-glycerol phosphate synthase TrpC [Spiribacter vilamensis]